MNTGITDATLEGLGALDRPRIVECFRHAGYACGFAGQSRNSPSWRISMSGKLPFRRTQSRRDWRAKLYFEFAFRGLSPRESLRSSSVGFEEIEF